MSKEKTDFETRGTKATEEINKVCEKYEVALIAQLNISENGIAPQPKLIDVKKNVKSA